VPHAPADLRYNAGMLSRFDHLTIAVREFDAAVDAYTRLLGAAPVWLGDNPALGSATALFALANGWVELLGARAGDAAGDGLREWLAQYGEGLQAIAFGTEDAQAVSSALRERGLRATPPQAGESQARDGRVRRFRTVELSPRATRGLSVFAVERVAGELSADVTSDPSAPSAIDHVVIRTAEPDAAIALYGQGLGIRLALDRALAGRRMLFFRVGGVTLEVVQEAALGERDAFYGAAYRVMDIDGAHARLLAAGFALSAVRDGNKPGTRVFTVRDGTCGVPTLILRDPARDALRSDR
jgi:catechol 2,3-dioxygenase-like lactoylglutathione lyase family enzyme